jgi:hypothetical protein
LYTAVTWGFNLAPPISERPLPARSEPLLERVWRHPDHKWTLIAPKAAPSVKKDPNFLVISTCQTDELSLDRYLREEACLGSSSSATSLPTDG